MEGPKPKKTGGRQTAPRPTNASKRLPYELTKPGQGPGETPVPGNVRGMVKGMFKQKRLPKRQ